MIVKVSNTGGDVAGNQFDLMIPGGGVGQNANTCGGQWKLSSSDLGPAQGGFLTSCTGSYAAKKECVRAKCMKLPDGDLRKGCLWFVDWYGAADNPNFRYAEIADSVQKAERAIQLDAEIAALQKKIAERKSASALNVAEGKSA